MYVCVHICTKEGIIYDTQCPAPDSTKWGTLGPMHLCAWSNTQRSSSWQPASGTHWQKCHRYSPHLGLWKLKVGVQSKTCIQMFTATLFIFAKRWKQIPIKWGNGWVHTHTHTKVVRGILFSHKKEWNSIYAKRRVTLKNITLGETKGCILYDSILMKFPE
jgi:hypothetical protein